MYCVLLQVLCDIISCLIDSALQRTPRGGNVDLSMRADEASIVIEVVNSGQEMAARLQDLLQTNTAQRQVRSCHASSDSIEGQNDFPAICILIMRCQSARFAIF